MNRGLWTEQARGVANASGIHHAAFVGHRSEALQCLDNRWAGERDSTNIDLRGVAVSEQRSNFRFFGVEFFACAKLFGLFEIQSGSVQETPGRLWAKYSL